MSNEINSNEILSKFDGFYDDAYIIKTIIINKMKWNKFFFNLDPNMFFWKIHLKINEFLCLDNPNKG